MLIKRKSIEKEESSRPARKPKYAPVTLSEQDGVRYLHFGTEWVQGAMRIRKPDWPELEYAQQMMAWMLWLDQPRQIAQLGDMGRLGLPQHPRHHLLRVLQLRPVRLAQAHRALHPFRAEMQIAHAVLFRQRHRRIFRFSSWSRCGTGGFFLFDGFSFDQHGGTRARR